MRLELLEVQQRRLGLPARAGHLVVARRHRLGRLALGVAGGVAPDLAEDRGVEQRATAGTAPGSLSRARSRWWIIVVPRESTPTRSPSRTGGPRGARSPRGPRCRAPGSPARRRPAPRCPPAAGAAPRRAARRRSSCVKRPPKAGDSAITTSSGRVPRLGRADLAKLERPLESVGERHGQLDLGLGVARGGHVAELLELFPALARAGGSRCRGRRSRWRR